MERYQDKGALGQARMRDNEVVLAQHEIAKEQNVEIERARTVALTAGAVAAEREFEIEQRLEQLARGHIRFKSDNGVEEARLIDKAHGRGGVERRAGDDAAELRETVRGGGERSVRRPGRTGNIGAEADIGDGHLIQSIALALLLAQRLHGLNGSGPARRNQRRSQPNRRKRENHGGKVLLRGIVSAGSFSPARDAFCAAAAFEIETCCPLADRRRFLFFSKTGRLCPISQDAPAPPVIASGFRRWRVAGSPEPPLRAGLRPSVMDEEDGRTGARARQSGQLNASQGVSTQSLRHSQSKTFEVKNLGAWVPHISLLRPGKALVHPSNSVEFLISKESTK